jgi:hypothetical protein
MIAVAAPAPLRMRALFAVPVVIVAVLLVALLVDSGAQVPDRLASFRLSDIDEGATPVVAAGKAVVLVRTGDDITALIPAVPDQNGFDPIVRCPNGELWSEIRASAFTAGGHKVGGPAARDLDRYAVRVRWDEVLVDTSTILRGEGIQAPAPVPREATASWPRLFEQGTIRGLCR